LNQLSYFSFFDNRCLFPDCNQPTNFLIFQSLKWGISSLFLFFILSVKYWDDGEKQLQSGYTGNILFFFIYFFSVMHYNEVVLN